MISRVCFGTYHIPACRPARPLCRAMRKVQPHRRPCHCGAAHFSHRTGWCEKSGQEAMNLYAFGGPDDPWGQDKESA